MHRHFLWCTNRRTKHRRRSAKFRKPRQWRAKLYDTKSRKPKQWRAKLYNTKSRELGQWWAESSKPRPWRAKPYNTESWEPTATAKEPMAMETPTPVREPWQKLWQKLPGWRLVVVNVFLLVWVYETKLAISAHPKNAIFDAFLTKFPHKGF